MRYGTYAPFEKLAADEQIGKGFDQRFATDPCVINGIEFTGPKNETKIYDVVAKLPDGTSYKIDQTGEIKTF